VVDIVRHGIILIHDDDIFTPRSKSSFDDDRSSILYIRCSTFFLSLLFICGIDEYGLLCFALPNSICVGAGGYIVLYDTPPTHGFMAFGLARTGLHIITSITVELCHDASGQREELHCCCCCNGSLSLQVREKLLGGMVDRKL
jgi:hypothetical protein